MQDHGWVQVLVPDDLIRMEETGKGQSKGHLVCKMVLLGEVGEGVNSEDKVLK